MNDFIHCKELKPYQAPTQAMRMGAPGKFGLLDLVFELDENRKSIMRHWERRAPLIVQQELYFDESMPEMPCVYILSAGGPNVDGDRYENRFTIERMPMLSYRQGLPQNCRNETQLLRPETNVHPGRKCVPRIHSGSHNPLPQQPLCHQYGHCYPSVSHPVLFGDIYRRPKILSGRGTVRIRPVVCLYPGTPAGRDSPVPRKDGCGTQRKTVRGIGIMHHYEYTGQCHCTHATSGCHTNLCPNPGIHQQASPSGCRNQLPAQ